MQLPRGTFHSMKKGLELGTILLKLKDENFSGSCSLVCESQAIDMVFQDGRVMLASCDTSCGDAAMDIISQKQDCIVDASLSDLTPAQLRLTLEFNNGCRVRRQRPSAGKTPAPAPDGWTPVPNQETQKVTSQSPPVKNTGKMPAISSSPVPAPVVIPRHQGERERGPAGSPALDGDEYTIVDRDLDALDAMDLDTMSEKIRMNCKTMIEKLHLEHLIDDSGK
ncbi:MAG TPA: hypothetical protein PKM87_06480 [Methanolinea sp.]|nr:hypothetical protein [Methanolinea sp.]